MGANTDEGHEPVDERVVSRLTVRLGEGSPEQQGREAPAPAAVVPLTSEQTQRLLDRLPPLEGQPDDTSDFALRPASAPPPQAGEVIQIPFPPPPPPEQPPTLDLGPLTVLRFAPEGEIEGAANLSITFSQPMVALSSLAQLAQQQAPAQLTPQPPGRWRWVGTQTLLFEPEGRFPMATHYRVEVAPGLSSAMGRALAQGHSWEFATPPLRITSSYPSGGPQRRDQTILLGFDQRVDVEALLPYLTLTAAGKPYQLRLASAAELDGDRQIAELVGMLQPGRWIALKPAGTLPAAAEVVLTLRQGAPSAEGPRTTAVEQRISYQTYGPLKIERQRCGWNDDCRPGQPWTVEFSNPLDEQGFDPAMVQVEPALPGMRAEVYGSILNISGAARGRTRYKVTITGSLPDQFGQTLGQPAELIFQVGPAEQMLFATGGNLMVLGAGSPLQFPVYSINYERLNVRVHAVQPSDWPAYEQWRSQLGGRQETPAPPGRTVVNAALPVQVDLDAMTETAIDLSAALPNGLGHCIVVVEPPEGDGRRWRPSPVHAWVQVTAIGLAAFVDDQELIGWATALQDGRPLEGVALSLGAGSGLDTDARGLAILPLPETSSDETRFLVARRGQDTALLPERAEGWWSPHTWQRQESPSQLTWHVFDDRGMYRPGEEVHIKGWLRQLGMGEGGDVGLGDLLSKTGRWKLFGGQGAAKISWTIFDSRGNELGQGETELNQLGGFDLRFELPPTVNLGSARVQLETRKGKADGSQVHHHHFEVQEFRRPEFEVSARAGAGPYFPGGHAVVSARAAYYAGGGLPDAETSWHVTASRGSYTPPNRGDFTFGTWRPWWESWGGDEGESDVVSFSSRTGGDGEHHLRIDFQAPGPRHPTSVRAEATIQDVNRQAWTASATLLVHAAELYVGLRAERTFVQADAPFELELIVVDLDGAAVAGRSIALRVDRAEWARRGGEWRQEHVEVARESLPSGGEAVRWSFTPPEGGTYRVRAMVMDEAGRANESELTFWVAGGKQPPSGKIEREKAALIPDRQDYQPGETAEILVQAPFFPAQGLLTLRRSGIIYAEHFSMAGPSHTLRVPIEAGHTPNVYVQVDLVGAADREGAELMRAALQEEPSEPAGGEAAPGPAALLARRPAYAMGSLNLPVPPRQRSLALQVEPRDSALEPGGETSVAVAVRDAFGQPVGDAELTLVVVDEAILALSGYALRNPLDTFHPQRPEGTHDYHLRAYVRLPDIGELIEQLQRQSESQVRSRGFGATGMLPKMAAPGGGAMPPPAPIMQAAMAPMALGESDMAMDMDAMSIMAGGMRGEPEGGANTPIAVRTNFNPLALFAASAVTDELGRAELVVKLPDNLSRYRVMAVAVAGERQFGTGEAAITARLPLMIRPSAPRFLNFGDRCELPVVLQNQTDRDIDVHVALRVAGGVTLQESAGLRTTVPAEDRVEVRFPAHATSAGTARLQAGAAAGAWADAAEVSFPIWTPATTEAFATYGVLDDGAVAQPILPPPDVFPQFGGLEITTSSTALQALTDAVLYITAYPFDCAEQVASRVLAIAALRDVLGAFHAAGLPSPEELGAAVTRDMERLQGMQNGDGGFGFWRRGERSWPYVSLHVAHALQRAQEKGYAIPGGLLHNATTYVRDVERNIPPEYSEEARRSLIAYALYVQRRLGEEDTAPARQLLDRVGVKALPLEALGWLLSALGGAGDARPQVEAIHTQLKNRVSETAATAHFVSSYSDGEHFLLHSNRRTDAILLEALIATQPQSDLIPKITRGLLAHRVKGRWGNTQENVWVLLALDRYFQAYERQTPDFVARAWLGEQYAGDHAFRGHSAEQSLSTVPMRALVEGGEQNLVLQKQGQGRLYYRVGLRYAPASLRLDPASYGFTVERAYEAVDDPADVRRDEDGTWRVRAGASVRVRLTLATTDRRYHVALVDPLPAGLEALNPALAVSASVADDHQATPVGFWFWQRPWFQHQNLRDERAEAFSSLLWEGVYTYSYIARATTPGSFVVPPARAEEMYHPEVFGRSASDQLVVE